MLLVRKVYAIFLDGLLVSCDMVLISLVVLLCMLLANTAAPIGDVSLVIVALISKIRRKIMGVLYIELCHRLVVVTYMELYLQLVGNLHVCMMYLPVCVMILMLVFKYI